MNASPLQFSRHDVRGEPDQDGQDRRRHHHHHARASQPGKLEPPTDIPEQVPDAVAQMIEEEKGHPEQNQPSEPMSKKSLRPGEGLRSIGRRGQPVSKQQGGGGQNHARQTMRDRQDRGDLGPIDLQVGRTRPASCTHRWALLAAETIRSGVDAGNIPRNPTSANPFRGLIVNAGPDDIVANSNPRTGKIGGGKPGMDSDCVSFV